MIYLWLYAIVILLTYIDCIAIIVYISKHIDEDGERNGSKHTDPRQLHNSKRTDNQEVLHN